ncbi:hypothetical protein [Paenibacillus albus]|uniref:DUF4362 domain-containing protein n=1 Tax=Paenibacillus albus TaxID=2495582 RepID=A0A3S9A5I5_9BACL|nr:hypothetical protein [Paenibacillus albus]AZN40936.1 hypothetical protein EJC50_15605 [Paenibacillus albus]
MRKVQIALLAVLLLLTGCGEKNRVEMAEAMPDDFDFSVRFGYGEVTKNEVNTYTDMVTKDLIVKGSATANLTLTEEEMATIYSKMKALEIMNFTNKPYTTSGTRTCEQTPYGEDTWKITANGITRELSWTDRYCSISDDAIQLRQLREDIMQIVAAKEEYKAMPESEGGYD